MCACTMCMYIRIHISYIYLCVFICIYILYIYKSVFIYTYKYILGYIRVYVYMYIYTYMYTYIHIYVTYKHTSITQCFPLDICTIIIYLYCVWEHICIQLLILLIVLYFKWHSNFVLPMPYDFTILYVICYRFYFPSV